MHRHTSLNLHTLSMDCYSLGQVYLERWKSECKRAAAADEWSDPPEMNSTAGDECLMKASFFRRIDGGYLSLGKWQRKCRYSNIPAFSGRLAVDVSTLEPHHCCITRYSRTQETMLGIPVRPLGAGAAGARDHCEPGSPQMRPGWHLNVMCDHCPRFMFSTHVLAWKKSTAKIAVILPVLWHDGIVSWFDAPQKQSRLYPWPLARFLDSKLFQSKRP